VCFQKGLIFKILSLFYFIILLILISSSALFDPLSNKRRSGASVRSIGLARQRRLVPRNNSIISLFARIQIAQPRPGSLRQDLLDALDRCVRWHGLAGIGEFHDSVGRDEKVLAADDGVEVGEFVRGARHERGQVAAWARR